MTQRRMLALWATMCGVAVLVAHLAGSTQSAQIEVKVDATVSPAAGGLGTNRNQITSDYTQLFSNGTGANQANNIYDAERTLAASATEDLDLNGTLTNTFGETLDYTIVKALVVKAAAANTNNVEVGGGNTSITTIFGDTTDVVSIRPGGVLVLMAPDATGYAITAGSADVLTVTNSSSGTSVTYQIIVIGVEA